MDGGDNGCVSGLLGVTSNKPMLPVLGTVTFMYCIGSLSLMHTIVA